MTRSRLVLDRYYRPGPVHARPVTTNLNCDLTQIPVMYCYVSMPALRICDHVDFIHVATREYTVFRLCQPVDFVDFLTTCGRD